MKLYNPDDILRTLQTITEPGQCFEIRVLAGTTPSDRRGSVYSGYFDDPAKAVSALDAQRFVSWKGAYCTPNPVKPGLLQRAVNKFNSGIKSASDGDIVARRWLLVDVDPTRPAETSSSDAEHAAAAERINAIDNWLWETFQFPPAIVADSGNGGHLLYRVDLPADDNGLIKKVLEAIAAEWDDETCKVDCSVFNPARIWRWYGSLACKGDRDGDKLTPPRPWRQSKILVVPDALEPVPLDKLEAVAALAPQPQQPAKVAHSNGYHSNGQFDLEALLRNYSGRVQGPSDYAGKNGRGKLWKLIPCPWNSQHDKGECCVIQFDGGGISAGCFHNSCSGKSWTDLRDILEPNWREAKAQRQAEYEQKQRDKKTAGTWREMLNGKPTTAPIVKPANDWVPFPVGALPQVMRNYVRELAASVQCDESFVALPLLALAGSAIGATRRLRLTPSWTVPPILWVAVLGESGRKKSPALIAIKNLIQKRQDVEFREHERLEAEYQEQQTLYERELATWKKNTKQDGEPPPQKPQPPTARRYLVEDCTLETLAKILKENPKGVLRYSEELGSWLSFGEYKKDSRGDLNRWLSLWNGDSVTIDRASHAQRTTHIPRTAISIFGGTQPETLAATFGRHELASGLAARLLFCQPPARLCVWRDDHPPLQFEQPMRERIYELQDLSFVSGGQFKPHDFSGTDLVIHTTEPSDSELEPVELTLASNAKPIWRDFYNAHNRETFDLSGNLAAAFSKLEAYAPRLALILQLTSNPHAREVGEQALEGAIRLVEWFKLEATRLYGQLALSPEQRDCQRTFELIQRNGGRITGRELMRRDKRFATAEAAEAFLQQLTDSKIGTWEPVPPGPRGGKPTREFVLAGVVTEPPPNPAPTVAPVTIPHYFPELRGYCQLSPVVECENSLSNPEPKTTQFNTVGDEIDVNNLLLEAAGQEPDNTGIMAFLAEVAELKRQPPGGESDIVI
ncbi:MAG: YfjI family protein [Pirellulales bacterium]|nr:YfjI family protein [Pirellulales bacterium]